MKLDVFDSKGTKVGQADGNDAVFGAEVNPGLIWEFIEAERANQRQGTAATRNRALQHGGGRKPYRQKGTGRARQGSRRSTQWVGGATVFGPRPRDYSKRFNRKARQLAYRGILTQKVADGTVKVVKGLEAPNGKTREVAESLKSLTSAQRVVCLIHERNDGLIRGMRNIPYAKLFSAERLSGHALFYAKDLLITEDALAYINQWLGGDTE